MKFVLSAKYVCVKNTRKNVAIRGHSAACVVGMIRMKPSYVFTFIPETVIRLL